VDDMLTRLRRLQMEEMEKLRREKDLKRVRLKRKLHPRIKLGLMRMGFDVEYEKEN